jgi:hypothetical protein
LSPPLKAGLSDVERVKKLLLGVLERVYQVVEKFQENIQEGALKGNGNG